jgi:hypothetical protein
MRDMNARRKVSVEEAGVGCSARRTIGSASRLLFDPNGIRLKMTVRTEAPGGLHRMASVTGDQLTA